MIRTTLAIIAFANCFPLPAQARPAEGAFSERMKPVPPTAKFEDPDYYIWGASMVRDQEGLCHLFYSRWRRELGHNAWVTHSEIAHATSADPLGPYKHVDVVLPARGAATWDGLCTHNPTVHEFEGRFYLYYMGNTGDGKATRGLNWTHRNKQRIGVADADHPNGPWKRSDSPLIDVASDPDSHDALMTSNPSILRRPDGTYLMVYKAVGNKRPLPGGGPVVHLVATSDSPTGPFVKHPDPVFTAKGDAFPAEDPFIWTEGGQLWAIVKDMKGAFTKAGQSLALFRSQDGFDWEPAEHPLVAKLEIRWQGGRTEKVAHLERPQLWLKDGVPRVLFCAADRDRGHSFNVHIPLTDISPETPADARTGSHSAMPMLNVGSQATLPLPSLDTGDPGAGKMVAVTPPEYAGTQVFHTLYLPGDWNPNWREDGERLPIVFEYAGNKWPTCGSTGEPEDACLGYGLSEGRYIWVSLPYVNQTHDDNEVTWWGDAAATVHYAKTHVPRIIENFGGDPDAVFLCGFSRGAIAVNYIGLHDDEIAGLWTAFIAHDHFDGVREWRGSTWGSPLDKYRKQATERLRRVNGRPYLARGSGGTSATELFIRSVLPKHPNFHFYEVDMGELLPTIPNDLIPHPHTDRWLLVPSAYRDKVWKWINGVVTRD